MAKAEYLKALLRSYADGDDERFYSVALQIAAQAARQRQVRLAAELRNLVDEARVRRKARGSGSSASPVAMAQPRGELAGLLMAAYPKIGLRDMSLEPAVRDRLTRVLLEQRQRTVLRAHGLDPIQKLLLIGPPGTGKTMTAAALAGDLTIPLFTIQLDGLITKYLGETASKLRLIFDAIRDTRAVYLFDEFDALGGDRGSQNDIGEIRRVLNSFLQFLESDDSDSLVVSATNHSQLLDRALYRRFDLIIDYPLPSPVVAERVMQNRLAFLDTAQVDWATVVAAGEGLSHAELSRACEYVAKNAILNHSAYVGTAELLEALQERKRSTRLEGDSSR